MVEKGLRIGFANLKSEFLGVPINIMSMTISDVTLKYLCQKYSHDIATGTNKFLPGIKVRYVAANKRFGYAYFGNFFFFGDDFYVWEQDEEYAEDHNQDVVDTILRCTHNRKKNL